MHSLPITSLALWDFSLTLYTQPGVEECCLRVQNEHGVNVNVLLWSIWLGVKGYSLTEGQLMQMLDSIQQWDTHYVVPLRMLRQRMKNESSILHTLGIADEGIESVRSAIKHAELQAERQLLLMLERQARAWIANMNVVNAANSIDCSVRHNIYLYLHSRNITDHAIESIVILTGTALALMA